jgi:ribosomal protein S18 acetylase RimI-like enzyme
MELQHFHESHLAELMTWFKDEPSCKRWGGPEFRFPFDAVTFKEDCKLSLSSWSFIDSNKLCAFGQFYLREGRCHLARLVVSPAMRSQGIGKQFIVQLASMGCSELNVNQCSLFVLADNAAAMRVYRKLGFETSSYRGELKLPMDCLYMVSIAPLAL